MFILQRSSTWRISKGCKENYKIIIYSLCESSYTILLNGSLLFYEVIGIEELSPGAGYGYRALKHPFRAGPQNTQSVC